jgi:hypothetical protein
MQRSISTVLVILLTLPTLVSAGPLIHFHEKPYVMYSDKNHPLSDTAVFSTLRSATGTDRAQIFSVDGKKTSCWKVGCPLWVRVLPGEHKIKVGLGSYYLSDKYEVTVVMKPRHVYEAEFLPIEHDKFEVTAQDLGENPEYGIKLGLPQKYFRVQF